MATSSPKMLLQAPTSRPQASPTTTTTGRSAILSQATGREIRYIARSHDDTRAALRRVGLAEATIEASLARFREVEAGVFAAVSPALGEILGRPPRSFASYAREHDHHW